MGVEVMVSPVTGIGEAAGKVWRYLSLHGPVSLTELTRKAGVPRDLLMQAVGWLAREDKLLIVQEKRKTTISLAD